MTSRTGGVRFGVFGVTLVLFFLPFATASCPGLERSFSGMALAVGTTIEQPQMFGPPKQQRIDGEPLMILALGCAVLGILGAAAPGTVSRALTLIAGLGGGLLLVLAQWKLGSLVAREGQGLLRLRFDTGYWLALVGFLAGAATAWLPPRQPGHQSDTLDGT